MGFITLVVIAISIITLNNHPSLREPGILIPFSILVIIHLILHWQLETITQQANRIMGYIVVQGVLAFILSWIGNENGLIFALFMALIGEVVGLFGLTRRGWLAGAIIS